MSEQVKTPSGETMPLVCPDRGGLGSRLAGWGLGAAVGASLLISPWPAALLVGKVFAASGGKLAAALEERAPAGVLGLIDERYGADPDMLIVAAYKLRPGHVSGAVA